jgi:dienelactone hydrolase
MRHNIPARLGGIVLALILAGGLARAGEIAGPQGPAQGVWREQPWLIPIPDQNLLMHAKVLRPPDEGPFPLVVINHGSTQNSLRRAGFPMPEFRLASQWFLERGYAVVLPLRPGHGLTGGPYFEDQGRCESADYRHAGLAAADSIAAAIDYMAAQPFVRAPDVVVVGESAGGWGAIALSGRRPDVRAAINFAGGRGGRAGGRANSNCSPERLIAAAGDFGRAARAPMLWLYAENDSYFAPGLAKRMHEAFSAAGGRADYRLLPAIGADGHAIMESEAATALWAPVVAAFLARQRPQRLPEAASAASHLPALTP